jgi:hypothetical protein
LLALHMTTTNSSFSMNRWGGDGARGRRRPASEAAGSGRDGPGRMVEPPRGSAAQRHALRPSAVAAGAVSSLLARSGAADVQHLFVGNLSEATGASTMPAGQRGESTAALAGDEAVGTPVPLTIVGRLAGGPVACITGPVSQGAQDTFLLLSDPVGALADIAGVHHIGE